MKKYLIASIVLTTGLMSVHAFDLGKFGDAALGEISKVAEKAVKIEKQEEPNVNEKVVVTEELNEKVLVKKESSKPKEKAVKKKINNSKKSSKSVATRLPLEKRFNETTIREVKKMFNTIALNRDDKAIAKLFSHFNLDPKLLKNHEVRSNLRDSFRKCDSRCQMVEKDKSRFLRLANVTRPKINKHDVEDLYEMMNGINYILNEVSFAPKLNANMKEVMTLIHSFQEADKKKRFGDFKSVKISEHFEKIYNTKFFEESEMFSGYKFTSVIEKCIMQNECDSSSLNLKQYWIEDRIMGPIFLKDIEKGRLIVKKEEKRRAEEKKKEKRKRAVAAEKAHLEWQKKQEETFLRREAKAKDMGYKNYFEGVDTLVEKLHSGETSLKEQEGGFLKKGNLWRTGYSDYEFETLLDGYAVYRNGQKYTEKIIFNKQKGKFYKKGDKLNNEVYFTMESIREFKTLLGTQLQAPVFKIVDFK